MLFKELYFAFFRGTFLLLLFSINPINAFGQNHEVDSLTLLLNKTSIDTSKFKLLQKLAVKFRVSSQLNPALSYALQGYELSNQNSTPEYKAAAASFARELSIIYSAKNDYPTALSFGYTVLKIKEELNDKNGIAEAYTWIAILNKEENNFPEAIKNYKNVLTIHKELGDTPSLAWDYNELAEMYSKAGDTQNALESYKVSMRIFEDNLDTLNVAYVFFNLGNLYSGVKTYTTALEFYMNALMVFNKYENKNIDLQLYANIQCEMARTYLNLGEYRKASQYAERALQANKINNGGGGASCTFVLSNIYYKRGLYQEAKRYCLMSLEYASKTTWSNYEKWAAIKEANALLSQIYVHTGNAAEAVKTAYASIAARDSLYNVERSKKAAQIEMKYDFDKREAISAAEKRRQRMLIYFISGIGLLLISLVVVIYLSLRAKQQTNRIITAQKQEVERQKHLVEEKQTEIIDSIRYAKRIQSSLLPTEKYIQRILNERNKNSG